jgi:hypothetical protein
MSGFKVFPIVLCLALGACRDSGEMPDTGGAGSVPAAEGTAPASDTERDLRDLAAFDLTMERVDRYYAAQRNIMLAWRDMTPAQREAAELSVGDDDDMDAMVAKVNSNPIVARAVRDAGLSAREYTMTVMALFQASMAAAVAGTRPELDQDSIAREMKANPRNVAFMREHQAELTRRQEAFQSEMEALGATEDDN